MKILLPLAALAAGFLTAPTAQAQVDTRTASRTVHVADLRLDTDAGVARLDRRLHLAARDVCAAPAAYDRSQRKLVQDCVAQTLAATTTQRTALLASIRPTGAIQLSAK
ncbi:UrcA family protein [Sphingomonas radiodurans]|uniref:UrcA family protein n=1 Tax=Sphingomonas radiodurans TaxID=2890321 RepID=UPI001E52E18E|nr:UrcA family protein [Sphingomonas radiodurans]WBH16523.1 UrcA family protein [Sphingomonas radiodurans]